MATSMQLSMSRVVPAVLYKLCVRHISGPGKNG